MRILHTVQLKLTYIYSQEQNQKLRLEVFSKQQQQKWKKTKKEIFPGKKKKIALRNTMCVSWIRYFSIVRMDKYS